MEDTPIDRGVVADHLVDGETMRETDPVISRHRGTRELLVALEVAITTATVVAHQQVVSETTEEAVAGSKTLKGVGGVLIDQDTGVVTFKMVRGVADRISAEKEVADTKGEIPDGLQPHQWKNSKN